MTENDFLDRCAVVTGAASGIGAACALELIERGAHVLVVDSNGEALDQFEKDHADVAGSFKTCVANVALVADWTRLLDDARAAFGPVTILVNNAAISPKRDGKKVPAHEMSLEEWDAVLAVNLTGPFIGSQAVFADMKAARWGRIINMSSQAARTGARIAGVHYGATKTGLLGLTRTLALEFGSYGITVNAITPGRIMSPMAAGVSDEVNAAMLTQIPVGRLGMPEDTASVVGFLASNKAGFITGATIDSNGGSYMG